MSGCEWVVDAHGCEPAALASLEKLGRLFASLQTGLGLHPVRETVWHQVPAGMQGSPGGITGLSLLAESHLTCHTFPEHGSLCLNLFCCRYRPDWDFDTYLKAEFGAARVGVRRLERPYQGEDEPQERALSELRSADRVPLV